MKSFGKKWQNLIKDSVLDFGIKIDETETALFSMYAAELVKWNKKTNITSITDPVEIAVKHFIDSIIPLLHVPKNARLLDIGTGGGFPGIPLKIADPDIELALIEASGKKINFLKQIIRILKLENAEAFHARAEDMSNTQHFSYAFDAVICRALSSLEKFVDIALDFVKTGGVIIALKGTAEKYEKSIAGISAKHRQLSFGIHGYSLPVLNARRSIITITKFS